MWESCGAWLSTVNYVDRRLVVERLSLARSLLKRGLELAHRCLKLLDPQPSCGSDEQRTMDAEMHRRLNVVDVLALRLDDVEMRMVWKAEKKVRAIFCMFYPANRV